MIVSIPLRNIDFFGVRAHIVDGANRVLERIEDLRPDIVRSIKTGE
jgi:hypothetical protein